MKDEADKSRSTHGVAACFAYAFFSIAVTLTNKAILGRAQFNWSYPTLLLLVQSVFTITFIKIGAILGFYKLERLKINLMVKFLPLNILFVLMTMTSNFSLQLLSVAMVTIFKHIQTIIVAVGDKIIFKEPFGIYTSFSFLMMISGSIIAGINDLEFNLEGYIWIIVNCVIGASYVLYMKQAMKATGLDKFSSVYYNNSIAIPLLIFIALINGESNFKTYPYTIYFWVLLVLNGIFSFFISISAFWCVATTSPTTYSIVGAVNKLPLSIISVWLFNTKLTLIGGSSGFGALLGGVIYALTKPLKPKSRIIKNGANIV